MNSEGQGQKHQHQAWCARSDPRMNRALEARLQNPSLSLYACLRMGGFEFPRDEANSVDSDNVTLAQRKNQLNRRLRSYRKRLSQAKAARGSAASASASASGASGDENSEVSPLATLYPPFLCHQELTVGFILSWSNRETKPSFLQLQQVLFNSLQHRGLHLHLRRIYPH